MGTGDYICITVRGGAPWGFSLRDGDGDTYRYLQVYQVEEGGRASLAGVSEGDEIVSLNGEPCADLTLSEATALLNASTDCLQLLVKRCCSPTDQELHSEYFRDTSPTRDTSESTTLHILSPGGVQTPRELYVTDTQDEAYHGEAESDTDLAEGTPLVRTQLCLPSLGKRSMVETVESKGQPASLRGFSQGDMVELQLSLSEQSLEDPVFSSLGSAHGVEGAIQTRESEALHTATHSLYIPCPAREPLGQHGVVLSHPSQLGQVEVILQHPAPGKGGEGDLGAGGSVRSGGEGEEGGGHSEEAPASFCVSFGIPSEGGAPAEEWDSDSELSKPSKHRARHARLRRSESLSDKQVKEAKSKCKRIAILLNADAPNPNNKGVLMFKRHRQRAKKYTLVSYGTGESEPEYNDDEEDAVEFTLVTTSESELDEDLLTDAQSGGKVLTFDWDKGLLDIERKFNDPEEMERLPETKGKGAVMFAQRRLRMDEITAEHEELRRQGIPVEGIQVEKQASYQQMEERSYMQSNTESQAYMDVNMHQSQQQYQQYYDQQQQYQYQQQPYEQQQQQYEQQQLQYQQQQQYEQQQLQYEQQKQQYEQQQQQYQQTHMYQQQQQHQIQQYSATMNGVGHQQANDALSNRTAKPFSAQSMAPAQYSPTLTNQDGQGEQIASRDERISVPAIKTGILQEPRRRNTVKPMFSFKDTPKMSPNPELLNLLNRSDKKLGFESGPEEDYLSLGAEACNFLQSPRVKHKTPPPVAPKPFINPSQPPWSPQLQEANFPQDAENTAPALVVGLTAAPTPALDLEPVLAPAPECSPPPAPQEVPPDAPSQEEHTESPPEPQDQQQPQQVSTWEGNGPTFQAQRLSQPEPPQGSSWAPAQTQHAQNQPPETSWKPAEVKPQVSAPSQAPSQLPWVTPQPLQPQSQPQTTINAWTPAPVPPTNVAQQQVQQSWAQPQEQPKPLPQQPWAQPQEQAQPQPQPSWAQPQEQAQPQPQPPWAQPQEQAQPQPQPPWIQPQEQAQPQPQPPWAQPQEQAQSQPQPPWAQPQEQAQSQPQPPWAQPQEHVQPQPQPPWVQPQEQAQSQPQPPWAQPQEQAQSQPQPQPPWVQPQEQAQLQIQPPWAQPQEQVQQQPQPPWVQQPQTEPQPQPAWAQPLQNQAPQQAWNQAQAQPQPMPPWMSSTPQLNAWTQQQNQAQPQPPWVQTAQINSPTQPPPMNAWAPAPAQAQPQPPWVQQPPEQPQTTVSAWAPNQNQTQPQPSWSQPTQSQSPPQPNWQQAPQQPPMNAWGPPQARPQIPSWTPQPQQPPVNTQVPMVNHRVVQPSPKPWSSPHSAPRQTTPSPQRANSSSPINPMASVLTSISGGSSFEMPAVKGKGAELFAKRQSRMEKFVVDSETVQANKARPASPASSTPSSWKYSPNIRAPPPLSYNPIQSPSYPPGAIKQPPPASPSAKAKKGKGKDKPAPKPLAVIDVMKHQPYQLDSSLFTYGPAMEAKPPVPKPPPAPAPAVQNLPIRYEQAVPVQPAGPINAPYPQQPQPPQQPYGMAPQPPILGGQFHQAPPNAYPPVSNNPYQQTVGNPYQQAYNPHYQQSPPAAFQAQGPNSPYQQLPQAPYQTAHSPPYQPTHSPPYQSPPNPPYQSATSPTYQVPPTVPYKGPPPSTYVVPSFPLAARPDSASGSSVAAAPKPRFTAKKSSAQVWRPGAPVQKE